MQGVLLLQNNAPAYISQVAMAAATKCSKLSHPPYSPDLAPLDFYLFQIWKLTFMAGILLAMKVS